MRIRLLVLAPLLLSTGCVGELIGYSGGTPFDGGTQPNPDGGVVVDATGFDFPATSIWYQDFSQSPVDPHSASMIQALEDAGGWAGQDGTFQIDFSCNVLHADASVPRRPFSDGPNNYGNNCDTAPMPLPVGGSTEGEADYFCRDAAADCHLMIYQGRRLYEAYQGSVTGGQSVGGTFSASCGVVWDLDHDYWQPGTPFSRGDQCSSADAAGFPLAPLTVLGSELEAGVVSHALRFILRIERIRSGVYVHPATHAGGPQGGSDLPPYGSHLRLKASFDESTLPNDASRAVARALKKYGMYMSDGGNVPLTMDRTAANFIGSHDLELIRVDDFEVLPLGTVIPLTYDCDRSSIVQ